MRKLLITGAVVLLIGTGLVIGAAVMKPSAHTTTPLEIAEQHRINREENQANAIEQEARFIRKAKILITRQVNLETQLKLTPANERELEEKNLEYEQMTEEADTGRERRVLKFLPREELGEKMEADAIEMGG
jgi:hypothetical protein